MSLLDSLAAKFNPVAVSAAQDIINPLLAKIGANAATEADVDSAIAALVNLDTAAATIGLTMLSKSLAFTAPIVAAVTA